MLIVARAISLGVSFLAFFSGKVLLANNDIVIPQGVLIASGLEVAFVAKFALFFALVLLGTIFFGKILKYFFSCPVIAGQIIGGIFLGPSFFNIANWPVFSESASFLDASSDIVYKIASTDLFIFFILLLSSALTVSYLMWIAGHETDIQDIIKVGLTAVVAGILGALLPVGTIYIISVFMLPSTFNLIQSIGIGLIFSATSVSIPVAMLFSQGRMHLQSSKATLGAAIIDDIFAVILLSMFFIGLQTKVFGEVKGYSTPVHTYGLFEAVVYMIISFAVIFLVGFFLIPKVLKKLKQYKSLHLMASTANGTMLLYFAFAELIGGLAGITGAYFAGLFHRMGDKDHSAEKIISPFVSAILLPLFLGSIGLQINILVLTFFDWVVVGILLIGAIASKMVGCYLAALLSNALGKCPKQKWRLVDSYLFGSSMVARGEVGLVIATILRSAQVITAHQHVISVVVIILTTIAAPIMLNIGFTYLDSLKDGQEHDYELNVGVFSAIGTIQLFNIIIGIVESAGLYKTTFVFSEGRKIVNLEGENVKIVLCPQVGVLFEGNKEKISNILKMVKSSIILEASKLQIKG